jgi:hypothetical protein
MLNRPTHDLTQLQVEALAGINHERSELYHWLNERRDIATAAKLIPIVTRLTHLLIVIREKQPAR